MPVFPSSRGGSSSSGDKITYFDAEEVGKRLDLDAKTVEWLKNEEPADDDYYPILVLNYQDVFMNNGNFDANKHTVSTALTDLGATRISDNVFKFDDWTTMNAARDNMWINFQWCFFHPHLDTAQQTNISHLPTISTTVITWCTESEGKLTLMPYEFFKL